MRSLSVLLVLSLLLPNLLIADDWPQFRGPTGTGISDAKNLPSEWSESNNIAWKTEIFGKGWSSPVVADGQVWLTTATSTELSPELRAEREKKAAATGGKAFASVTLYALQMDLNDGQLKQKIKLFDVKDPQLIHTLNSFASPTPVIDSENVIVNFGTFGTACLNRNSGEVVWKRNDINIDHETGPGSSPVIWNDLLIMHFDGIDSQFVIAMDKTTGKTRWQTARSGEMHQSPSMQKAFATPLVVQQNGKDVLISPAANWVYAYDPKTGQELWKTNYGKLGFSCVPRPIVNGNMVYVCTSFMRSTLLAIDISSINSQTAPIKWEFDQQVPNMSSPILIDGKIYFCSDRGIATCVDSSTGQQVWRERLGGDVSASPVYGDGKLFMSNRNGETFVIEPGDKLNKIATNKLDSRIMGSPAIVDNSLLIRTEKYLYRIKE